MAIKSGVSLYSLQYQFLNGKMTLNDLFEFVKSLGASGVEILPDQMLRGTPTPSEETYAEWNSITAKHGLDLICDDILDRKSVV